MKVAHSPRFRPNKIEGTREQRRNGSFILGTWSYTCLPWIHAWLYLLYLNSDNQAKLDSQPFLLDIVMFTPLPSYGQLEMVLEAAAAGGSTTQSSTPHHLWHSSIMNTITYSMAHTALVSSKLPQWGQFVNNLFQAISAFVDIKQRARQIPSEYQYIVDTVLKGNRLWLSSRKIAIAAILLSIPSCIYCFWAHQTPDMWYLGPDVRMKCKQAIKHFGKRSTLPVK